MPGGQCIIGPYPLSHAESRSYLDLMSLRALVVIGLCRGVECMPCLEHENIFCFQELFFAWGSASQASHAVISPQNTAAHLHSAAPQHSLPYVFSPKGKTFPISMLFRDPFDGLLNDSILS